MSDKMYNRIKNFALIVAPILTFISALLPIWNVPYCDQIIQTCALIDTLCGAIVVVAKKIYDDKKGE